MRRFSRLRYGPTREVYSVSQDPRAKNQVHSNLQCVVNKLFRNKPACCKLLFFIAKK